MKHPRWSYGAVLYEMNVRQMTMEGTLRAATDRLEFLNSIGVDAVWLMPIYPIGQINRKGSLGSYYSIRDYCAVNAEFGTIDDLKIFVDRAHSLGMKVLLDWVANHTSRDAVWLDEKPSDWYKRDADGEAVVPCDWTDTAKLNYDNHNVWHGQIDAMKFWIDRCDIDGFRCDMAMLVPIEFWRKVTHELRGVKPDIFMLAEAENTDLFDSAFDACYGWNMHHLMNDVARQSVRIPALRERVYADMTEYPCDAMKLMFTSNHDENSWNGSEFARMGAASEIMAAMTFLLPQGMPLIYTGQEIGLDRSLAFFDRDPITDYTPNTYTDLYRRLIKLKHASAALAAGEEGGRMTELHNNAEDCLMTFVRERGESRVVAEMNLSPYKIHADFNTGIYAGEYTDAMTGRSVELPSHVERDMDGWSYRILFR